MVIVIGCGPVGQFAIASCILKGVSRIFAIDSLKSRLDLARRQGAECINFNEEDPTEVIKDLTHVVMANIVIDTVGVDAVCPSHGPAGREAMLHKAEFKEELAKIAPKTKPQGKNWIPGNGPSQVLRSSVELVSKCGTISIIGVYPETAMTFPIGKAMNKNLKIVMGNCHHRAYIPRLLKIVQSGMFDPTKILSQTQPLLSALDAYKQFDARESGWIKVALKP